MKRGIIVFYPKSGKCLRGTVQVVHSAESIQLFVTGIEVAKCQVTCSREGIGYAFRGNKISIELGQIGDDTYMGTWKETSDEDYFFQIIVDEE